MELGVTKPQHWWLGRSQKNVARWCCHVRQVRDLLLTPLPVHSEKRVPHGAQILGI